MLWSGTRWPERLREQAAVGGESGRRANRDLDAICALFDIAHRSEEVSGLRGVTGFLAEVEGQQIPADTLGEADLRGSAVRLLTAHRAKGLEWDLVVVAGVQEGAWPDIRRRGSLLEPDRLGPHGLTEIEPTASRIAEERRLFYVACTRARRRLVVTAVAGTEGEGDQPSRFLTELGARVVPVAGTAAAAADPGRVGRRAAPDLRGPRVAARPAGGGGGSGWPGSRTPSTSTVGRWCRWPTRSAGGGCGSCRTRPWPSARRTSRSRCRAASSPGCWAVRGSGSCPARARPTRPGTRPPRFGSVIHVLADHGARSGVPAGRAGLAPGAGVGSAELRRQLAVVGRAGRGRGGAGSVRHLAGGPTRDGAARHRGPVPGAGRPGVGPGAADRQRRSGGARSAGPHPDRRLQDLASGPAVRRRRRPGPDGGLPARGAGRRLRRRWPVRAPGRPGRSWSTCGCPTPRRVPVGCCPSRSTRPRWTTCRTRPTIPTTDPTAVTCRPIWICSRPGCTGGSRSRRTWSDGSGSSPGSAPAAGTARSRPAARPNPRDGRSCGEGASTCPSRTGRAPSSAPRRSCPRPWPSRSPTSSWRRSRPRWSPA